MRKLLLTAAVIAACMTGAQAFGVTVCHREFDGSLWCEPVIVAPGPKIIHIDPPISREPVVERKDSAPVEAIPLPRPRTRAPADDRFVAPIDRPRTVIQR